MPKLKTRQAIVKRFKITKNKKITHRTCGQDHFNAKESSRVTMQKRRRRKLDSTRRSVIIKALPYN